MTKRTNLQVDLIDNLRYAPKHMKQNMKIVKQDVNNKTLITVNLNIQKTS